MSIPSDLLDQLLTGYLDNALSPDERTRVEALLESDPQVAADLAELKQLQQSLRSVAKADASIHLDQGFADRVLDASIDRARNEGLGDDHPLVRLADQPSAPLSQDRQSFPVRYAVTLVGLAASIAIAVFVLRPDQVDDGPIPKRIAKADVPAEVAEPDATFDPTKDTVIANDSSVAAPAIASAQPAGRQADQSMETETSVDRSETPAPLRVKVTQSAPPKQPADRVSEPAAKQAPAQQPAIQHGAILVLDVRLTAIGRMKDAISAAMQDAGLNPADKQELPDELVGAVNEGENETKVDDDVTVMYLQASAKTLDRLYLSLMSDQEGIDSIGMSLAVNAPILKVVDSIAPDPTTVRHDNTALQLSGQQAVVGGLAGQLDQLRFTPLNRATASAMSTSSGPDVPSQILLLVR
jgi:hypothetical protein